MTPGEHRAAAESLARDSKANLMEFVEDARHPGGANVTFVAVAHAQAALAQVHATLAAQPEAKAAADD